MNKILDDELEIWFRNVYPYKLNSAIAFELSKKINARNRAKAQTIRKTYGPLLANDKEACNIVARLEIEVTISENQVKMLAKARHLKKASAHVSRNNRIKAEVSTALKWKEKCEVVTKATEWITGMKVGEVKYGIFENNKKLNSLSATLCRINKKLAVNDMFISAKYNKEFNLARIECSIVKQ